MGDNGHPLRDGLSQAEPDVSALRASIPDAVRIITRRELLNDVPSRFSRQYSHCVDSKAHWKEGFARGQIIHALNSLSPQELTAERIDEIIGNDSWTAFPCIICGKNYDWLFQIGDQPDYDARWVDVCINCISDLHAKAIEAGTVETGRLDAQHESAGRKALPDD